jgi:hypothetical protein
MTARRVREYVYTDLKGKPKLRKRRFVTDDPKRKFRMDSWSDKGQSWVENTTSRQEPFKGRAMYQLRPLLWALDAGAPVYWCEGEKDADAVTVALGSVGVGTSHWQGACNATAEQATWFSRGIGPVYVVVDVDHAGAACGLARRRLLLDNGASAKRLTLLAPPRGFNDAADAIMAGHRLDDFREVTVPQLKLAAAKYVKERAEGGRRTKSDWYGPDGKFQLPKGWDR